MKKRGIFLIALIAILLVVTGCSNKTSKTSAPTNKIETKLYDKLSKSDRGDVQFTFKRHDSTIKGHTRIDLVVKNKSNKNVKLNLADIVYLGSDSLESDKTGKRTVKVNKSVNIKGIFKDVDETIFNDPGLFCYRNDEFKLAYADGKTSKSSNLKDSELKKDYRHFMAHKDDVKPSSEKLTIDDNDSNSGSDSSSSDSDTTTDESSDTSDTTQDTETDSTTDDDGNIHTGKSVNSPSEAIALVKKEQGVQCTAFSDNGSYLYDTDSGIQGYWLGIPHHIPNTEFTTYATQYVVLTDGTILEGNGSLITPKD